MESGAEFLDFVKFGWGTAIVTTDLQRKIDILDDAGVDFYFGGTLFEKFVLQDRFDDFRDLCESFGCRYVEVSNGTIDLSHIEKAGYVRKLAAEFNVVSEVGFKDTERSERLAPNRWIECIHEDLEAGAFLVTLESTGERPVGHLPAQRRAPLRAHRGDPGQRRRGRAAALRGPLDAAPVLLRAADRTGRQPRQRLVLGGARARDDPSRPARRHARVLRKRGVVRESRDVFHLAIPVDDLDEAQAFYVGALGLQAGPPLRRSDHPRLLRGPGGLPPRRAAESRVTPICASTRGTSASPSGRPPTSTRSTRSASSARSSSSPT